MRRQGNRNARTRRAVLALLLSFCVLSANRAEAEGSALVIGIGTYAGQPTLARCVRTAQEVADALRRRGLQVAMSIDAPSSSLRNAIEDLSSRVAAAFGAPAVVYVCAAADAVASRVFLLPADVDLRRPTRVETAGVVAQATLNALAGAGPGSALVGDFTLLGSPDDGRTPAAPQAGLSHVDALALLNEPANDIGLLGRVLATTQGDWASVEKALQSQVTANASGELAFYYMPAEPRPTAPPASSASAVPPANEKASPASEPVQQPAAPEATMQDGAQTAAAAPPNSALVPAPDEVPSASNSETPPASAPAMLPAHPPHHVTRTIPHHVVHPTSHHNTLPPTGNTTAQLNRQELARHAAPSSERGGSSIFSIIFHR
jgi:hypothetical protein